MIKNNVDLLLQGIGAVLLLLGLIALIESIPAKAAKYCYESVVTLGNSTVICYDDENTQQIDCYDYGCVTTDLDGDDEPKQDWLDTDLNFR